MKLPIRVWRNHKEKCWRLLDTNNKIIADNLTKESAETLEQAVNFCSPSLNFVKLFIEYEYMIGYREDATDLEVAYRSEIHDQALTFMIELGLIEPPPKYVDALPAWCNNMIEEFEQDACRMSQKFKKDDNFMDIYKRIKGE